MTCKKTTLIALLDKPYPPDHSFVTGMLAQALAAERDVRVQMLVMGAGPGPNRPVRYHRSTCLPMVPDFSRRGGLRLKSIFIARHLVCNLIAKANRRGERVVLFVRNHPALMLVAASLRHRVDRFVFQNSHPLELQHRSAVKRLLHRTLLSIGGRSVDGLIAVSPLGLKRARELCSAKVSGLVIPLMSDLPYTITPPDETYWVSDNSVTRFIYIGTHGPHRRMDVVLRGVVDALDADVGSEFVFVGGRPEEVESLREIYGVIKWEAIGRIRFVNPLPRARLPSLLKSADVGLSLIPSTPQYREASPTKLSEYMGAGLAVVASLGIDLQEKFMRESQAGVLVPFRSDDIAGAIEKVASNRQFMRSCQKRSKKYAEENLHYNRHVSDIKDLIN